MTLPSHLGNYRQAVNELFMKTAKGIPDYQQIEHSGPDHLRRFRFKLVVDGKDYPGEAAPRKDQAKESAAKHYYYAQASPYSSLPIMDRPYRERTIKFAACGTLIVVDVEKTSKALQYIEEFCDAFPEHDVCHVIGCASFSYERNMVPSYVNVKNASSLHNNASEYLMFFEVAKLLPELKRGNLDRVLAIGEDRFIGVLKEFLDAEGIPCDHAATREQVFDSLIAGKYNFGLGLPSEEEKEGHAE